MNTGLQKFKVVREDEPKLTLRDRLRDLVRAYVLPPLSSSSPEVARYFSDGAPTSTGLAVNEHSALNYSAVFSAVNLISGDIASLPLQLFKRDGASAKTPYRSHPLYYLLHDQPNPEMTSVVFRQVVQGHALTWGNGYAEIVRDNANRPVELWPITPDRVVPFRASKGAPLQYRVTNYGAGDTLLNALDVLHIPGLGYDGIGGYSVIRHARESIGLGLATERFGGTFFGEGATFGGVIAYKGAKPTDGSQENLINAINAKHKGVDKSHRFLALYNDATYTRLGIPPDDAQFLQTRQFQVNEIARWFNIPPHKLAELERATHSNIEQQEIDYVVGCLGAWLQKWEQELTVKLIASSELNQQLIEHNVDARLKGDSAARGELYSKLFSVGSVTPNLIAAKENLPSIKGGDRSFVPLNMVPLDRVDEYIDAVIEGHKTPKTPPAPAPNPPANATNREEELEKELAIARRLAQEREDATDLVTAQLATEQAKSTELQRAIEEVTTSLAAAHAERDAQIALVAKRDTYLAMVEGDYQRVCKEKTELDARHASVLEELSATATRAGSAAGERDRHAVTIAEQRSTMEGLSLDIVDRDRQIGEATHRANTSEAVIAELRAQIVALGADLVVRTSDVMTAVAERTRLETVLAERDAAIATANASIATLTDGIRSLDERIATTRRAMRNVAVDLFGFFIDRETGRARRAQGSPEKLTTWAQTFYPAQHDVLYASLRSVSAAMAENHGTHAKREDVRACVEDYLQQSQRELLALAAEHDEETLAPALERVLGRWETERAEQAADTLLRKVA